MNLKKSKSILLVASALLMASCANTITKEEAVQFAKDNYTATESKKPSSLEASWDFSETTGLQAKTMALGLVSSIINEETVDIKKSNYQVTNILRMYPAKYTDIEALSNDTVFTLNSNELSFTTNTIDDGINCKVLTTYNQEGYQTYTKVEMDGNFTLTTSESSLFKGWIECIYNY